MMDLNSNEKMQRWCGYVKALEEERNKILVFQRELPLSLELLTQAIEACKKKTSGFATMEYIHAPSDGPEQTLSEGPVLAHEFISIKRACSCLSDEEDDRNRDHDREKLKLHGNGYKSSSNVKDGNNNSMDQKVDWLRSVQLWTSPKEVVPKELMPKEVAQRNRGAFHPFQRGKSTGNRSQVEAEFPSTPPLVMSSTAEGVTNDGCKKKEETKEGRNQKKQRRSWSLELHKRFLDALQQLGGSHAATPKQIRELMKVNGLTNDEVKSHLQKYRLNIRRPSTAIRDNNSPHSPQYAVAGGILVPPSQYAAATTNITTSGETANVINTQVSTTALPPSASPQVISSSLEHTSMQTRSEKSERSRGRSNNDSEDGSQANSLSTSSIHTTTVSMPVC